MATVAGCWGWRERIRHRHFRHWWYMRLSTDSALECTRCHAIKPDDRPSHFTVPRANELDIIKENPVSNVRKALVAVAGVLAALGTVLADGGIDAQEAGVLAGAVAVAVGVYLAKNEEPAT